MTLTLPLILVMQSCTNDGLMNEFVYRQLEILINGKGLNGILLDLGYETNKTNITFQDLPLSWSENASYNS